MTNPTANDAAGVSQETAKILHDLELAAMSATNSQKTFSRSAIDAAIDRLIVLDHAANLTTKNEVCGFLGNEFINTTTGKRWKFDGKSWTEIHPRERALHQDAKRGNFRQEDDGA